MKRQILWSVALGLLLQLGCSEEEKGKSQQQQKVVNVKVVEEPEEEIVVAPVAAAPVAVVDDIDDFGLGLPLPPFDGLIDNNDYFFDDIGDFDDECDDSPRPRVISVIPADDQEGVALNSVIIVNFNRSMKASSINDETFIVTGPGSTEVSGSITYNQSTRTATFTPNDDLIPNTIYTVTVEGRPHGVEDAFCGRSLQEDYVWTFTTLSAPEVSVTSPLCGSVDVPTNQIIAVAFNEPVVAPTTLNFLVNGGAVAGTVAYDATNNIATFTPTNPLAASTLHTITIESESPDGVQDLAGNFMAADFTCDFTTGAGTDLVAPTVIDTIPTCDAVGVSISQVLSITFSRAMNSSTISETTVQVNAGAVTGDVTIDSTATVASFAPDALTANTLYTLSVSTGAQALNGVFLAANFTCNFTTGALPLSTDAVALGAADDFVILARSAISNSPTSSIDGQVGLARGTSQGLSASEVVGGSGDIHVNDAEVALAQAAFLTAYNDASSRTSTDTLPNNLAALTLTPGVYTNAGAVILAGKGDKNRVTLDAEGNPNAVFIFQMESLTTAVNSEIILKGQAQAENVFWQVGDFALLNLDSIFKGTILAADNIYVGDDVSVEGRLFAGALSTDAAVTLITTTVVKP